MWYSNFQQEYSKNDNVLDINMQSIEIIHQVQNQLKTSCEKPSLPRNECIINVSLQNTSTIQQPRRELKTLENCVNQYDGRQKINNTTQFPYSAQCCIKMTYKNGQSYTGSGTFISPKVILTAAHNLFDRNNQASPCSIQVIPGLNGENAPFGIAEDLEWFFPMEYKNNGKEDYGIIIIKSKTNFKNENILGQQTGHLGLAVMEQNLLMKRFLIIAGYPGDKRDKNGNLTMQAMGKHPSSVTDDLIFYQIDTASGQSGSGVWFEESDKFYVAGVHTHGGEKYNEATIITIPRFLQIQEWIRMSNWNTFNQIVQFNTEIYISGIKLNSKDISILMSQSLSHVRTLKLSNIKFDDKACEALASKLKELQNLTTLDLSYNLITHNGMITLARELHHCKKLTDLNLYDNKIGGEAIYFLASQLREHKTSLKTLSILYNDITWKDLQKISSELNQIKNLEYEYDQLKFFAVRMGFKNPHYAVDGKDFICGYPNENYWK